MTIGQASELVSAIVGDFSDQGIAMTAVIVDSGHTQISVVGSGGVEYTTAMLNAGLSHMAKQPQEE